MLQFCCTKNVWFRIPAHEIGKVRSLKDFGMAHPFSLVRVVLLRILKSNLYSSLLRSKLPLDLTSMFPKRVCMLSNRTLSSVIDKLPVNSSKSVWLLALDE